MTPFESRRKEADNGSAAARLIALCGAVYFTSYLTRKCYEASILSICDETGLARTAAGLAGTAAVALYGSGQFITGLMADRLDPRRIVLAALLLTAACNAAMPAAAAGGAAWLVAVNAVNGFAQAMFWPPLVKLLAAELPAERYRGAVFAVNVAANVAIIAVFALVAGCVRFTGWRWGFASVAAAALCMAAAWWRAAAATRAHEGAGARREDGQDWKGDPDSRHSTADNRQPGTGRSGQEKMDLRASSSPREIKSSRTLRGATWLLPVALAIVCLGALRDGIEAWAPAILRDLYGIGASKAVFSVALLPVFAVASMAAARALRRRLGGEDRAALALFATGLACALALRVCGGGALAAGLPLLALLSAAMHGANLMLVCELPGRFAATGRVGAISGALNACVYVGASLSIYGFAALREHFAGWSPVFVLWGALLLASVSLCAAAIRLQRKNGGGVL